MQDAPAAVKGVKPAHRAACSCVRASVHIYAEGASSLRKWRHSPRIDHDVFVWEECEVGRVATAHRAGRFDVDSPGTSGTSFSSGIVECKMRPLAVRV